MREVLYSGLGTLLAADPAAADCLAELLLPHLRRFYDAAGGGSLATAQRPPPLLLERCAALQVCGLSTCALHHKHNSRTGGLRAVAHVAWHCAMQTSRQSGRMSPNPLQSMSSSKIPCCNAGGNADASTLLLSG